MQLTFYIAGAIAVFATTMVITRYNIIHALLYLVVSFLALSVVFFILGAPFAAVLEVIVYAGAIVVLIIFVIMMLNLKEESVEQERLWLPARAWIMPSVFSIVLLAELIYVLTFLSNDPSFRTTVDPKAVGMSLY